MRHYTGRSIHQAKLEGDWRETSSQALERCRKRSEVQPQSTDSCGAHAAAAQAISFQARRRRLRRRLQEVEEETVSFTAEARSESPPFFSQTCSSPPPSPFFSKSASGGCWAQPGGRGQAPSASRGRRGSPGGGRGRGAVRSCTGADSLVFSAFCEVGAAETLQAAAHRSLTVQGGGGPSSAQTQVRSIIVTEILEVQSEGSQPPPVAADGTWLGIVAVLLAGSFGRFPTCTFSQSQVSL